MRTNRFVLWLGLLVVATLSVGALSFLLLRREGDKMRDNAEQSRLMANEATSRAKLYHEMARQSRAMAEYAEQAAEDSLAIRARTVADNMDLTMADLKEGLMSGLRALPETNRTEGLSSWTSSNNWVDQCFVWGAKEGLSFPVGKQPRRSSPASGAGGLATGVVGPQPDLFGFNRITKPNGPRMKATCPVARGRRMATLRRRSRTSCLKAFRKAKPWNSRKLSRS